jgi:hypothetical protein
MAAHEHMSACCGALQPQQRQQRQQQACPGRPEQDAATWFAQPLAALRRHAASAAPRTD